MKQVIMLAVCAVLVGSASGQINVGPQIGGFGLGGSAQVSLMNGRVSVSAEAMTIPWKEISQTIEDVDYTVEPDILGGLVLLNIHPFKNALSIGFGAMFGGYDTNGSGAPTGADFIIDGVTYPAEEVGSLDAHFELKGSYPAAMVGFRGKGFNFGVGLAMTDTPLIELEATGPAAGLQEFQDSLERERQKVEDWFDFGFFPLFRFGYQFGF